MNLTRFHGVFAPHHALRGHIVPGRQDKTAQSVLYSFGDFSGDGESPVGGLIQTGNGNFYGTTSAGGTSGFGTVFDFTVQ